jgi:hypothetical protein
MTLSHTVMPIFIAIRIKFKLDYKIHSTILGSLVEWVRTTKKFQVENLALLLL